MDRSHSNLSCTALVPVLTSALTTNLAHGSKTKMATRAKGTALGRLLIGPCADRQPQREMACAH